MLGSLDPAKMLLILVLALVVLGPERLPRVARQAGAAWRELTRVREQVTEEVRKAIPDLDLPDIPHLRAGAVSSFLTDLTSSTASTPNAARAAEVAAAAGAAAGSGPGEAAAPGSLGSASEEGWPGALGSASEEGWPGREGAHAAGISGDEAAPFGPRAGGQASWSSRRAAWASEHDGDDAKERCGELTWDFSVPLGDPSMN